MVDNKSQAATEFLMTYGWAILVVIAAVGALWYFGVFSPSNMMPFECQEFCEEQNYTGCLWSEQGLLPQEFACYDGDGDEYIFDKKTKELKEIIEMPDIEFNITYNATE